MTKGIYGYYDILKKEIVYIGKDSNIDKDTRHKQHMYPSYYEKQPFNKVLQNNPERYQYARIYECPPHLDEVDLNGLEIMYIEALQPKFNFTDGGDGIKGYRHTEETKKKLTEAFKGENNPMYGKIGKNHPKYGNYPSAETRYKMSKHQNKTGYYCVYTEKKSSCKQGFTYIYQYYENRKRKRISSVDITKLEQKVKEKGLTWKKL